MKYAVPVFVGLFFFQFADHARAGHERPYPEPRFEIPMDKAQGTPFHVADTFSVGIESEVKVTNEINFDLDREKKDDVLVTEPSVKLKTVWEPSPNFLAYGEAKLRRQFIQYDPDGNDADPTLLVNEAYIGFRNLYGFSGTIGRREVSPGREWLFDTDLDGVDLVYRTDDFAITGAWWRERIVRKDVLEDNRDNKPDFAYLRGDAAIGNRSQAGLWIVGQNSRRRDRDEDLLFVGASSDGDAGSGIDYWAEAAFVLGQERDRQVRGLGFDTGVLWTGKSLQFRPHAALGLAFGSGDDGEGTDTAFRQTGVQGNSQRLGGVVSVQTYGELVDPELSNLIIPTFAMGIRPLKRTSVDFVYHEYFQHRASDRLRDTKLNEDPSGNAKHLGREFDVVIGIKESKRVSFDLVGGVFLPGSAFEDHGDPAWFLESSIELKF